VQIQARLFRDVIAKESNPEGKETAGRHGMTSPVWLRPLIVPTTCAGIGTKLSIAAIKDADALMADHDLLSLRHSSRFRELVTELQPPAARVPTQWAPGASRVPFAPDVPRKSLPLCLRLQLDSWV
jgi:hypothetical protein